MNPFKVAFSLFGLVYIVLLVWASLAHLNTSIVISVSGVLMCVAGWFMSDAYLS